MQDLFRTLPAILNDVEGAEAIRETFVFAAWKRIAGEALASRTVPLRLEEKRLFVAVSDSSWQKHLEDLSPQMVFRLNAAVGDRNVEFIEFVIDAATVEASKSTPTVAEDAEVPEDLRASAAAIEDERLREQFLAAAANCLARKKG